MKKLYLKYVLLFFAGMQLSANIYSFDFIRADIVDFCEELVFNGLRVIAAGLRSRIFGDVDDGSDRRNQRQSRASFREKLVAKGVCGVRCVIPRLVQKGQEIVCGKIARLHIITISRRQAVG